MEGNLEIEKSETNRGKEQIILNKKYKFNFSPKLFFSILSPNLI